MSSKLVCGIGFNSGKYPATVNGKVLKEYKLWRSILSRCYSIKYQEEHPTYIGCQVSENFKNYSYFHEWVQQQIGFGETGFELDKDLLLKGNRIYSEDTCVFIPKELNALLTKRTLDRGLLPIGVTKNRNKFMAQCMKEGKIKCLGTFDTTELAFQAYKTFKEGHIKTQAEVYKNEIEPIAYQALINYKVEIED